MPPLAVGVVVVMRQGSGLDSSLGVGSVSGGPLLLRCERPPLPVGARDGLGLAKLVAASEREPGEPRAHALVHRERGEANALGVLQPHRHLRA